MSLTRFSTSSLSFVRRCPFLKHSGFHVSPSTALSSSPDTLTFLYRNHKSQLAVRRVRVIRTFVGKTPFYPDVQPLLEAEDLDRNVVRVFACMNIVSVHHDVTLASYRAKQGLTSLLKASVWMVTGGALGYIFSQR